MLKIYRLYNNFYSKNFILFLIAIIIIFPYKIFNSPGLGLDPSWNIALELAIKKKLQFGNDIVFSWGPLSFLTMCLNIYESKALTIIFHLLHI